MSKRQHEILLVLLLCVYTLLGTVPMFSISFNYVTWFGIIYLIASYIRFYPNSFFEKKRLFGWLTLLSTALACASIIVTLKFSPNNRYFFVSDSNKFFALLVAVSSFLWFKNMNIKYNKTINSIGAATFGVLLIHANSDAMRTWLWKDVLNVVGHYTLPFGQLVLYSVGAVLLVFLICNLFDQLRIATLEKWFFNWYDCKLSAWADALVKKIIQN